MPGLHGDEHYGGIRVYLTLYHVDMLPDLQPKQQPEEKPGVEGVLVKVHGPAFIRPGPGQIIRTASPAHLIG